MLALCSHITLWCAVHCGGRHARRSCGVPQLRCRMSVGLHACCLRACRGPLLPSWRLAGNHSFNTAPTRTLRGARAWTAKACCRPRMHLWKSCSRSQRLWLACPGPSRRRQLQALQGQRLARQRTSCSRMRVATRVNGLRMQRLQTTGSSPPARCNTLRDCAATSCMWTLMFWIDIKDALRFAQAAHGHVTQPRTQRGSNT